MAPLITRRMRPWRGSGTAEIITSSSGRTLVSMNDPTKMSTCCSGLTTPACVKTLLPGGRYGSDVGTAPVLRCGHRRVDRGRRLPGGGAGRTGGAGVGRRPAGRAADRQADQVRV